MDIMDNKLYLKVILPLNLAWEPWYYTTDQSITVGDRVKVVLAHRSYIGVVSEIAKPDIDFNKIQPIVSIERTLERITLGELQFWQFISSYYLCPLGEVYKTAYPSGRIKVESKKARVSKTINATNSVAVFPTLEMQEATSAIDFALKSKKSALLECPDCPERREILGQFIQEQFQNGKDVLYLVPDKSFFKKVYNDLLPIYGEKLKSYSSDISQEQRRNLASQLRHSNEPCVVLGTRSSLFLPYSKLGLIIVDQEQSQFYKQDAPAPRYNAKDASAVLANIHKSALIYTTPCPSFEALNNPQISRVHMSCPLAPVTIIDTSAEKRKNGMQDELSFKALEMIEGAKSTGRKSIVADSFECGKLLASECIGVNNVPLIVLTRAELLVKKDNFRADERALALITQLRLRCAHLVVQTSAAAHPLFEALESGVEEQYRQTLINERKDFNLPPFSRKLNIVIKDSNEARKRKMEYELSRVFPELPIYLSKTRALVQKKEEILRKVTGFEKEFRYTGHIIIDVDPA